MKDRTKIVIIIAMLVFAACSATLTSGSHRNGDSMEGTPDENGVWGESNDYSDNVSSQIPSYAASFASDAVCVSDDEDQGYEGHHVEIRDGISVSEDSTDIVMPIAGTITDHSANIRI